MPDARTQGIDRRHRWMAADCHRAWELLEAERTPDRTGSAGDRPGLLAGTGDGWGRR